MRLTHSTKTGKKFEIRISKLETNPNDRNINDQNTNSNFNSLLFRILGIQILILFRISNFDIRILNLASFIAEHSISSKSITKQLS